MRKIDDEIDNITQTDGVTKPQITNAIKRNAAPLFIVAAIVVIVFAVVFA